MKSSSDQDSSSAEYSVSDASASDRDEWNSYVVNQPDASLYHNYEWRSIIEDVFNNSAHYLICRGEAGVCGILPLVRLRSFLFGDYLVSVPYLNYGGILATNPAATNALLNAADTLARELGVSHVELRHTRNDIDLPVREDKISMLLTLTGNSETLWKQIGSKIRAQIRRPQREGVSAIIGGVELLEDFYNVLAWKYRELGVPIYPRTWFESILKAFPEQARIVIVQISEDTAAAAMVIGYRGTLEVPYAAALSKYNRLGVNMFLYWTMLEYAENSGYQIFDFGRSSVDSGTYRFKKQWGAEAVPLYWHYWLRSGEEIPQLNLSNKKYAFASAAWRRLPLGITKLVGPKLVRNLP